MRMRRNVTLVVAVALAASALAPSARAAISPPSIDAVPDALEVRGPGAVAMIQTSPLRISYADPAEEDSVVLSQLAEHPTEPKPVPPTAEPEPFAADHLDRDPLYAPITYLVGASRTIQPCPGNVCGGNQLMGLEGGVEYSAKDVIAAETFNGPDGEGLRLTVSTNEPTGRVLLVDVMPGPGASMRTRITPEPAAGVAIVSSSFGAAAREAFRGFGGRHNTMNQRGHAFYNWPEQENSGNDSGELANRDPETYQFPNGPHAAYYVQALFYSSQRYGFLLNQTDFSWFRMASNRDDAWQVAAVADELDYVVAPGDAPAAIRTITDISGRHRVSPEWAYGVMTSLWHPFARLEGTRHHDTVFHDLEMIKAHDVVMDAYFLNGWESFDEATLRQIIDGFNQAGVRVLSYFKAFADDNTHGFSSDTEFQESVANGYAVKTAAGTPYLITSPLIVGAATMIDFTNPDAVEWWKDRVKASLALGFDGFMEDFGEQIHLDMFFHNGEDGSTMHNAYPNYYHHATRQAIEEFEADPELNPGGRTIWNFTRAGFSGTTPDKMPPTPDGSPVPGSAASEYSNFPGDNSADFGQASGLKSAAVDMLSRAVGGAWSYSTDIGGYLGETSKELFHRWTQWAALAPMFRLHNSSSGGTRQPWFFDPECTPSADTATACPTVVMWNHYAGLHNRARALILELAAEAEATGIPPTRPMWLAFPDDPAAAEVEQQWMLGEQVLVAPVVDDGARQRDVYFPAVAGGCWAHGEDPTETYTPGNATVPAPLERLPWFVPCGTQPIPPR